MTMGLRARVVSLVVGLGLAGTACAGADGESPATRGSKGGTLHILMAADFEHLDPARIYVTTGYDFGSRLLFRSLTQYKAAPGDEGLKIAPDLAVGLGQPSDNATTWTFKLKEGLKYEDGSVITSQDIKYGVERTFAPSLPEGPPWARRLLVGGDKYEGPYKEKGGLDSIETPNDRTIVFHLKRPVPDFNYATTFPMFAPVPQEKDTGIEYDNRPFSSGPYKIEQYDRGKQIVLTRNKHWDPSSDPVRKARPDKIVVEMGISPAVIDQRMLADQGTDQQAIMLGSSLQASSIARIVNDPEVKERLVKGISGCTRFLGLNTTHEPLNELKVRQAINYAISKKAYLRARGGLQIGEPASTILPPTMKGYQSYNLYPANNGKGDPEKAKKLLAEAGYPNGIELTLTSTSEAGAYGPDVSAGIQQALAKAGIKVNINPVSSSVYYTEIGNIKRETDMVFYGWCPDWPSGSTFLPPLFDGDSITAQGNTNVAQYDNPEVNKRIDEILTMADPQQANRAWAELDKRIMQDAPIVPLAHDNHLALIGSKVTGAFPHRHFGGEIDLATVGIEQ